MSESAVPSSPTALGSPPAVIELARLVELFNACEALQGKLPKWDRWNTRRMCEGAFGVTFRQHRPGAELWLTIDDLRESGLWAALQNAERLARRLAEEDDRE